MWDEGPTAATHRFFAYLNLFCFAMLVLVMGDNLPILFVGWEGVGLCSYLLIGFWYTDETNAAAGKKAFIVNRIGDFGLLVAMSMLVYYTGTLDWEGIASGAATCSQRGARSGRSATSHRDAPGLARSRVLRPVSSR